MLFWIIIGLWFFSEIGLGLLKRQASDRDRGSLERIWLTISVVVPIGVWLAARGVGRLASWSGLLYPAGLALMGVGLLIRWVAIWTLGRYFTTNVHVAGNHQLVQRGLYRWVRHPAYAGSLISFAGLGMALSSWVSFLVIFIPVFLAFRYRVQVEEAALREALGDTYERYCRKTYRFIPGLY